MPRPYFTKLVLPSTIKDKILRIPNNFLMKYGHELTPFARLIVPDGRIWQVGIRKVENKLWFHDGWREFMDRFSINVGYFLVFGYEGNCTFRIYIFNLLSSEINYQMRNMGGPGELGGRSAFIFEEMEDDDSTQTVIIPPPGAALANNVFNESHNKLSDSKNHTPALQNLFNGSNYQSSLKRAERQILQVPMGADGTNTPIQSARETGFHVSPFEQKSGAGEEKMISVKPEPVPVKIEPGSLKTPRRKRKKSEPSMQGSSTLNEEGADARFKFYENASARKRTVTAEERERALNAAKAFEPENPFCRVVVRPSYLYRGCIMYLPSCFAEKHLNGISGFIKLQRRDGRQWPVRCLYKGGRGKLSQGWYEFALENNLGEGDVCIFEILNTRDVIIQITMFRVMEDTGLVNSPLHQNVGHSKLIN